MQNANKCFIRGRGAFFLLFCSFAKLSSDLVTRPFSPPFRVDPGPLLVGSTDLNASADQIIQSLFPMKLIRSSWFVFPERTYTIQTLNGDPLFAAAPAPKDVSWRLRGKSSPLFLLVVSISSPGDQKSERLNQRGEGGAFWGL